MALVKTTKVGPGGPVAEKPAAKRQRTAQPAVPAASGRLVDRISGATQELASGLTEAAAAAEQLRRSMEQIAAGAEEAAGSSQEQLESIRRVASHLAAARLQAETSRRRSEAAQLRLTEAAVQIASSIRAIELNASRQSASLKIIGELERRAADIGEVSRTVRSLSDQTNLLALNAAIEAARAGVHGRGFAVVADEVRSLAAVSEKSAEDVQTLAASIESDVKDIAAAVKAAADTAVAEARAGGSVARTLEDMRGGMGAIADGSQQILTAAIEAERAAIEAQRGAEQVATAAEEQAAGATESQSAIEQQAQSLEEGQRAAQSLAGLARRLASGIDSSLAIDVGGTAEELSATIQELSSAATQITAAVAQISRGAEIQSAATEETSAAIGQIEKGARATQENATRAEDRVRSLSGSLSEGRIAIARLVDGVAAALAKSQGSVDALAQLEAFARQIERIVDAITLVAVQTTMLAVSGSVEAARSGDAGRGFALVSTDIRRLAREASQSIERVKETVRGMQDQISLLRRDLEKQIANAEAEVDNNNALGSTLAAVDEEIVSLGKASASIRQGADAILAAAVETAAGARQIAAAADQAGTAARQAAIASGQQARGAEDLAASIEEIASLASELAKQ